MSAAGDITEIHRMMTLLQGIDVGLVVVDPDYRVTLWNGFMENHSGQTANHVLGRSLFELTPDTPESWLRQKLDAVFAMDIQAFTTWEQRPFLFRFKNYRAVTGMAELMYQDISFMPLKGLSGEVEQAAIMVYDVTDVAENKLKLEAANRRLRAASRTDSLTGLYNRGYWDESLQQEFARFRRTPLPCSLVLFDIDHFKHINDSHGHPVGDEVLRHIGRLVNESCRSTDISGRYGGEEFAIILPDTSGENAQIMAEHLRKKVEELRVPNGDEPLSVTISIGISTLFEDTPDPQTWVMQADQALYEAKHAGRNRILLFEEGHG
jgi:diguanylate cyclase (GGDEF)-like protein